MRCVIMLKVDIAGLTGRLSFERGVRHQFVLDVLQLDESGFKKVSTIRSPSNSINIYM